MNQMKINSASFCHLHVHPRHRRFPYRCERRGGHYFFLPTEFSPGLSHIFNQGPGLAAIEKASGKPSASMSAMALCRQATGPHQTRLKMHVRRGRRRTDMRLCQ